MKIIELLTNLANSIPTQNDGQIKSQPDLIRKAIESNDNEILKSFISNKKSYSNEVKVTVY